MADLPVIEPASALAICGKCKATLYKDSHCDHNDPQCPLLTAEFLKLVTDHDGAVADALAAK